MSKTITPLHDHVLLRLKEKATTTPGGLYMAEKRNEHDHDDHFDLVEARVLAVGPGSLEHLVALTSTASAAHASRGGEVGGTFQMTVGLPLMPVKVGDIVLVCENALHHVDLDGEKYDICPVTALFGVIEGN